MNVYDNVHLALKQVTAADADLTLTCFGKQSHGNRVIRLHYKQNHLVCKVIEQYDLAQSPEVLDDYVAALRNDTEYPWLDLRDRGFFDLTNVGTVAKLVERTHLTASLNVAGALWGTLAEVPRESAFMRQWSTPSGGVGIELIVLVVVDGVRMAYEFSMNYYAKPHAESLTEHLAQYLAKSAS